MAFDIDELERIGTSALCNHRIPCDLSTEPAVNRFIAAAGLNWQAMIDEIRRLRIAVENLDDIRASYEAKNETTR